MLPPAVFVSHYLLGNACGAWLRVPAWSEQGLRKPDMPTQANADDGVWAMIMEIIGSFLIGFIIVLVMTR